MQTQSGKQCEQTKQTEERMGDGFPPVGAVKRLDGAIDQARALLRDPPPSGILPEAWQSIGGVIKVLISAIESLSAPTSERSHPENVLPKTVDVQHHCAPTAPTSRSQNTHPISRAHIPSLFSVRTCRPSYSSQVDWAQRTREYNKRSTVILVGMREVDAPDADRHDKEAVESLLKTMQVDAKPQFVGRIGDGKRVADGKPRLLRVRMENPSLVFKILSGAKTLKNNVVYKAVFIRKSMSSQERQDDKEMRAQLKTIRSDDPTSTFVIYRGQLWKKEEISSGTRVTVPPSLPMAILPLKTQGN